MENPSKIYEAILTGRAKEAAALVQEAVNNGQDPQGLLDNEMIPAMDEIGRRFESNEVFVPELLIAGRAMSGALKIIKPLLAQGGGKPAGRIILGTVEGDLHDIGKNLVGAMLEGGGFEVVDLGVNVPSQRFVEAIDESDNQILAMSALLTTTMGAMRDTIAAVEESGLRNRVKIIVGGAPVTQSFADEIKADGYGDNANSAVTLARQLVGRN